MNKQQTAVEWLSEQFDSIVELYPSQFERVNRAIEQAKEMEKMYYTEFEVLQLLLKLQQTESYDNFYDWFQENKKQTFNTKENGGNK
jgi:hypothetical protein